MKKPKTRILNRLIVRSRRIAAVDKFKALGVPELKRAIIASIPPSTKPMPPPVKGMTVNSASPRAMKHAAEMMCKKSPPIRLRAMATKKKRKASHAHTPIVSPVNRGIRRNEPSVPSWKWS